MLRIKNNVTPSTGSNHTIKDCKELGTEVVSLKGTDL